MLEQTILVLLLSLHTSDLSSLALPVFSRSHSQPDVDLSRPPEIRLHHQANLSVATGADIGKLWDTNVSIFYSQFVDNTKQISQVLNPNKNNL